MLESFKHALTIFVLVPFIFLIGFWLSIKFGFPQIRKLPAAWRYFLKDRDFTGEKSTSFSALSAVLGGNLGTGNIAGIAVALSMGGPGSIFWMWIIAILGAILKFAGCILAIKYRVKDEQGEWVGGPMYYLQNGLNQPFAAKVFCGLTICAAITVGNLVQMNSIALPLESLGVPNLATGIGMAILVGLVIMGGLHRFSMVVSSVVPMMAILYLCACSLILTLNFQNVWPAILSIFTDAFYPTTALSGFAGYGILTAINTGFNRGLFATDVGVGIAPIIHASVESQGSCDKTALMQGIISTLSPFIVMVVCTLTGLVLMVTGAWQLPNLQSTNLCTEAFKIGLGTQWAGHIVTITLFFFAFTTILTWSFCADKAIEYLCSRNKIKIFQMIFILVIPLGAFFKVSLVWSLADVFMNLMLLINLIGIVGLIKQVQQIVSETKMDI